MSPSILVNLFRPYVPKYMKYIGLSFLLALLRTGIPLGVAWLIDNVVVGLTLEDAQWLVLAFILGALFSFFKFRSTVYVRFQLAQVGIHYVQDVRRAIWNKLYRLPQSFFDAWNTGQITTRVAGDVNKLAVAASMSLPEIPSKIFLVTLSAFFMLLTDWRLFLLCSLAVPITLAVAYLQWKIGGFLEGGIQEETGELNGILHESLSGLLTVKSLSAEASRLSLFQDTVSLLRGMLIRFAAFRVVVRNILEIMPRVLEFGVIALGIWSYWFEPLGISYGDVVAFILYIPLFYGPLESAFYQFDIIQASWIASQRINDFFDQEEEDWLGFYGLSLKGSVFFDQVSFGYTLSEPVLRGISFRVHPGKRLALVGPTGSGKSTVIALLLGLYSVAPNQGRIWLDDRPLSVYRAEEIRAHMGLVTQELAVFSGSIKDNVIMGKKVEPSQLERALSLSGLTHFFTSEQLNRSYPGGELRRELSTGQKQLVAVARALLHDPPILIFDEATAALDPETESFLQANLDYFGRFKSMIFIAHRLKTITQADEILVIDAGQIVGRGTHEELLSSSKSYQDLVQAGESLT